MPMNDVGFSYDMFSDAGGSSKPQNLIDLEKKYGISISEIYAPDSRSGTPSNQVASYYYKNPQGQITYFDLQGNPSSPTSFGQIIATLAPFFLPGVGNAIGAKLMSAGVLTSAATASAAATAAGASVAGAAAAGAAATATATTIGTAIASTAVNVAQGQKFEDALKNSVVNAVISTGSLSVAKDINTFVGHPAVTDAIVSAGGSAIKTAAAGGTEQDIINNITGALAGSATSSAYQLGGEDFTRSTGRVLGSAVAGGVTGGGVGAITGALGELGGQAKGKVAGAIEDVISPEDTGALPASQVAAMTPTSDAVLDPVTITAQRPTDITSTNIISPNASITAPAAAALEPAGITNTEVMNAIAAETTPAVAAPAAEVAAPAPVELEPVTVTAQRPPADITSTDIISPAAVTTTSDVTDKEVLDLINVNRTPDAVLDPVTITAKRPPDDITSTDIIDAPVQLDDVTITGKREETPLNVAAVEEPAVVEEPAAVAEEEQEPEPEEKPAADKPYKPNLFILGGTKPKPPPSKTPSSTLSQALGTTTGLTSSRGAGEIEGPSTGKKRKKVWNEETLRLKDALGV